MKMRKTIIFIMMIATLLGGVFLANFQTNIAHAATYNNVGSQLMLVGFNGYSPVSYFDSMSQSSVVSSSKYLNDKSQITSEYYMVQANITNLFGEYSTASSSFAPFADYVPLANAGVLYAYGKVGIVASSLENKNKVTISLGQGSVSQEATNSEIGTRLQDGTNAPYYYKTQPIQIFSNQDIVFGYTNNAKSSIWSKAEFKLFEPSIVFKTTIKNITFSNTNQTVYHNEVVKLNATNNILNIVETGNLISYYKNIHKIDYEILEGAEIAKVIGNYLYFSGDVSGTVKIRAKTLADSEGTTYLTSQIVTYDYVAQKKNIEVVQNFAGGANVFGTGMYYLGSDVTLIANVTNGYRFSHWTVNGQTFNTQTIYFKCGQENQINLYLIKDISITGVQIKQREYDGTVNANIESIEINGILPSHDARITNLAVAYYSASAGTKALQVTSAPALTGSDAIWYNLSGTLPNITGIITPKIVNITVQNTQKIYGENDPTFAYTTSGFVNGENVEVNINRQGGEDVGQYEINATVNNTNYQVQLTKGKMTILPKALSFVGADISKVYDKTRQITFTPTITGTRFGDNISVNLFALFASENAGQNIVVEITNIEIVGLKKHNYVFEAGAIPPLTGTITQANINVTLFPSSKIYGSADPTFICDIDGVIDGDQLNYQITRLSGEDVGKHLLEFWQNNPNYNVVLFASYLTITPKNITVCANAKTKTYGNVDPALTYTANGLIEGDTLLGQLQREGGEQVGTYSIYIGSLANSNYTISYVASTLTILPKVLDGEVVFQNKIYDGTNQTNGFNYIFFNLAFEDSVTLDITAYFADVNIGTHNIIIKSYTLNNGNYTFAFNSLVASILPKNIWVTAQNQSKVYGQNDPQLLYAVEGLVSGDELNGNLQRVAGENVGTYSILAGSLTSENNPNYQIEYLGASLTITRRILTIQTISLTKFYSEPDPEFVYVITDGNTLAFDDKLCDIMVGSARRESGEVPGIYQFKDSNIHSSNNNYVLTYQPSGALTIKRINIKITVQNAEKVYGDPDPIFTFATDKPVGSFDFALQRQAGENVGHYSIEAISLYHPYIQIEFEAGVMQILPREITLRANNSVKYYGDPDPTFSVSIVEGILAGDRLEDVLSGNMQRQNGEQIGTYSINQGTLQISNNYNPSFNQGTLTILPRPITVKANNTSKIYGQNDPALTYTITHGNLVNQEGLTGSLERQTGELLGDYVINIGSLATNQNYALTFINGVFTVQKANVLVVIPNIQKVYGDPDPTITYETFGLPNGQSLSGNVLRKAGENVGQYPYDANLFNEYCEITYEKGQFEIVKRIVVVKADSHTITYGDPLPTLTYQIIIGSIVNGDVITGEIYKIAGTFAGTYVLNSTLNLGRNYKIEYISGTLTILPRQLTIYSAGASKIYGQNDPIMTYEIVGGALLPNDIFGGRINRVTGENVGIYDLVASFSNINYTVNLVGGKFEILPKPVLIHARVSDKVYDGTKVAYLYNVSVSGLIDENITLSYDASNCALYATSEVGTNIEVTLHNISLSGAGAENYQVFYPILSGNITHQTLSSNNISVLAGTNTSLHYGVLLLAKDVEEKIEIKNKTVVKQFEISLKDNEQELVLTQNVTVEYKMNKNAQNVKVYYINNGQRSLVESNFSNGTLRFETLSMGQYVIVSDNLIWLDVLAIFLPLVCVTILTLWITMKKRQKKDLD